jgi:hypothetical protein
MKILKFAQNKLLAILFCLLLAVIPGAVGHAQQKKIVFGIHADPVIGWFSSDIKETKNDGARPGFDIGLTFNKYFTPNYAFSLGLSIVHAGGRLVNTDLTTMKFTNFNSIVLPGNPVIYKIHYLSFPVGLKLQTNQIGYITFFSNIGLDPKIVTGGKADIPSLNISKENAAEELRLFNLSYHITAGIEYSLGGTTALVVGLNFDNNFLDITKDNGDQPVDKVTHKLLSFRLGVNF